LVSGRRVEIFHRSAIFFVLHSCHEEVNRCRSSFVRDCVSGLCRASPSPPSSSPPSRRLSGRCPTLPRGAFRRARGRVLAAPNTLFRRTLLFSLRCDSCATAAQALVLQSGHETPCSPCSFRRALCRPGLRLSSRRRPSQGQAPQGSSRRESLFEAPHSQDAPRPPR
jgi:hypothetical protein